MQSSLVIGTVGADNVGGYQHVVALVDYLYTLREKQSPVVTNEEAENIIRLWNNLTPYDQATLKVQRQLSTSID